MSDASSTERFPVRITCVDCGKLWIEFCACSILYGNGWLVTYSDRTTEVHQGEGPR